MRKAFTLVELLAVIIILGLIALIAVPTVVGVINDTNDQKLAGNMNQILDQSRLFVSTNSFEYKKNDGSVYCLDVEQLKQNNFLTNDFVENLEDELTFKQIQVSVINGNYDYQLVDSCTEVVVEIVHNKIVSGATFNQSVGVLREEITQILFNSTISPDYESATTKFDFSADLNSKEVIGYIEDSGEEKILHVQANGTIIAHELMGGKVFDLVPYYEALKLFEMGIDPYENFSYNSMFCGFQVLNTINFNNSLDTSKVTDMSFLFAGVPNIDFDFISLNTENVRSMHGMFYLSQFENLDLTSFDTSNVNDMSYMFGLTQNLNNLNLSNFNTSSVTNMKAMFDFNSSLTMLDVSTFDTSNVKDMSYMFASDPSEFPLLSLNLGENFNTQNVTNMSYMFARNNNLTTLDLRNKFNTTNVTDMSNMFLGNGNLTTLDLGNEFNTISVTDMSNMFLGNGNLTTLDLGNKFDTSNVTDMSNMFGVTTDLTNLYVSSEAEKTKFDSNREITLLYSDVIITVNP